ncbi:hypothetical protein KJ603_02365 [Patescibacteria group bacterium]|nr:hypothetical protein [Patescibacteria group bacterium]
MHKQNHTEDFDWLTAPTEAIEEAGGIEDFWYWHQDVPKEEAENALRKIEELDFGDYEYKIGEPQTKSRETHKGIYQKELD